MWVMKASKNFGKTAILKIWELIPLDSVKTDFGKLAEMMHFQERKKNMINWYYVIVLDPIRI